MTGAGSATLESAGPPRRSSITHGYWVRWSSEERAWEATAAVYPWFSAFGSSPEAALRGLLERLRLVFDETPGRSGTDR